jgi:hypothetical protein
MLLNEGILWYANNISIKPLFNKKDYEGPGGMTQVVECLPCKYKGLSSNPRTIKNKQTNKSKKTKKQTKKKGL